MSDFIGHHCGLAMVRLRQPLPYYFERYGDPAWGLRRLYLLMEKQHNRGQDGAGLATIKLDMPPGEHFVRRIRSDRHNAIERVFDVVMKDVRTLPPRALEADAARLKARCQFLGDLHIGHLRYGTHSGRELANCHPLIRKSSVASRNLVLAGNFNMTNSQELFDALVEEGLSPVGESDTQVILEGVGHSLDREHEFLLTTMGPESFQGLSGRELNDEVSRQLDLTRIFSRAAERWDGGFVFVGGLGNGDAFVCRDAAGIRPAYFIENEDVVAVASERAALAAVFNIDPDLIEPVQPGHVLSIKRDGTIAHERFTAPSEIRECSFERIYFSRGNDPDIYRQRKALGRNLARPILEMIDYDVEHAIFSYIPNTAEAAYLGLIEEVDRQVRSRNAERLQTRIREGRTAPEDLAPLMNSRIRAEKIAHKDQRLRTFITHDAARRDLVMHIYDITRGVVRPDDTLVVIDDSIVRGTTLRESIITILSRLEPKRIIVASSCPPIMYPDCYGIDMSQLGRFIAFEAAVSLLEERGDGAVLESVAERCRAQEGLPDDKIVNHVAEIYDRFTLAEISNKIAALVRSPTLTYDGRIDVLYQSIDGLHEAMPEFTGDWYFSGRYPTPGGFRVLNDAYLMWRGKVDRRPYERRASEVTLWPKAESGAQA